MATARGAITLDFIFIDDRYRVNSQVGVSIVLDHHLATMPEATRLVIALDPRRMIETETIYYDREGRVWHVFYYDLNDIDLRSLLSKLRNTDVRLLIVVQGMRIAPSSWTIDLSYIPDLVEDATSDMQDRVRSSKTTVHQCPSTLRYMPYAAGIPAK